MTTRDLGAPPNRSLSRRTCVIIVDGVCTNPYGTRRICRARNDRVSKIEPIVHDRRTQPSKWTDYDWFMYERRGTIFDDLRNFRNRPTLTISSAYEEYARDYVTLYGRLRIRYAICVHRSHSEYYFQLIVRIFSLFIKNKNKHTVELGWK